MRITLHTFQDKKGHRGRQRDYTNTFTAKRNVNTITMNTFLP